MVAAIIIWRLFNILKSKFFPLSNRSTYAQKSILNTINIEIDGRAATTVMLVSGGYPEAYEKGKEILGLDKLVDVLPFHAGASLKDDKVVTSGGRVIAITSYGNTYSEALKKSYQNIDKLHFDKMYYRKDIGFDL